MTTLFSAAMVQTAAGSPGDAVLVDGGRVAAVGWRGDLLPEADREHLHEGAVIIPGLRDAHIHPVGYAAALNGTTLGAVGSLGDLTGVLRHAAAGLPAGAPLIATRFDDASVVERRLPTRGDLDQAVADRPALIHRYCGHIAVANSAALSAAGVTADTPDPAGGSIDRDGDGVPTGVLRETAVDLVTGYLEDAARPGPDQVADALMRLAGLGITSIGAMLGLGDGPWASLGDEVELMVSIADDLPITVHGLIIARTSAGLVDAKRRIDGAGPRLGWLGLKLFADGSLGGHTAAMQASYTDDPEELGTMRLSDGDLELVDAALELGGMVAIHAIGDRANTAVLDHYEMLIDRGVAATRLRLEHASVLAPGDIERIGAMGIIASVQPAFIGSETEWLGARVGEDRLARTYPFASLQSAGATLAGGSDSPVESPDPFAGMALARDRAGMVREESVDGAAALGVFTDGGAAALGEPSPLAVGSAADFVVLDRNPAAVTPDGLRGTRVLATVVGGAEVRVDRSQAFWV
jgi:predicted amidohydrolase YtcJ